MEEGGKTKDDEKKKRVGAPRCLPLLEISGEQQLLGPAPFAWVRPWRPVRQVAVRVGPLFVDSCCLLRGW